MVHVVFDLEMNPISYLEKELRKKLAGEVIEIGAVKLGDNFQKIDSFQCYIKPQLRTEISKRITQLTGITDEIVSDKEDFVKEFNNFMNWIDSDDFIIYSWSDSDIVQLKSECQYKMPDYDVDELAKHWIDLQKKFDDMIGVHHSLSLKHAVGAMEHKFEGNEHSALADAENTAAILILMQDEKKFIKLI